MSVRSDRRKLLQSASLAALAGIVPTQARAQKIPGGTLRILVGFPAGGGTDVMARYIGEKLRERTGANVIVENRAGASGVIETVYWPGVSSLAACTLDSPILMPTWAPVTGSLVS